MVKWEKENNKKQTWVKRTMTERKWQNEKSKIIKSNRNEKEIEVKAKKTQKTKRKNNKKENKKRKVERKKE